MSVPRSDGGVYILDVLASNSASVKTLTPLTMSETTPNRTAATGEDSKPQTADTKEAQIIEPATPTEDAVEKSSAFSGDYDRNDSKDPKNWSNTRKHLIFVALMSSSLLCDG